MTHHTPCAGVIHSVQHTDATRGREQYDPAHSPCPHCRLLHALTEKLVAPHHSCPPLSSPSSSCDCVSSVTQEPPPGQRPSPCPPFSSPFAGNAAPTDLYRRTLPAHPKSAADRTQRAIYICIYIYIYICIILDAVSHPPLMISLIKYT